jgi:hypothetical protein
MKEMKEKSIREMKVPLEVKKEEEDKKERETGERARRNGVER